MKRQIQNINIVRSAWWRVKKDIKEAISRDLKPVKDAKGDRRRATVSQAGLPFKRVEKGAGGCQWISHANLASIR